MLPVLAGAEPASRFNRAIKGTNNFFKKSLFKVRIFLKGYFSSLQQNAVGSIKATLDSNHFPKGFLIA